MMVVLQVASVPWITRDGGEGMCGWCLLARFRRGNEGESVYG